MMVVIIQRNMKVLRKNLERIHFDRICKREKIYEGRPAEKLLLEWDVQIGDYIIFTCEEDQVCVMVADITFFPNFGEAYDQYGQELVNVFSSKEAEELYAKFPGYSDLVNGKGPGGISGVGILKLQVREEAF